MANTSGIRAGRAFVELGVSDKLTAGLRRAQRRLRAFGDRVRSVGARLTAVSAGVGAGFVISTRIFAGFDDRMRVVRAVTGATEQQFESLRAEAKRLGRTTSFTAGQVADAMTELGRAGFTPQAILDSTEAVLALARATDSELPRATEIAGAALRGFNLPATQMGRVADVLTASTNKSAQTLEDLFEAFKPVAPLAVEAGESIEGIAAAIGILANNGIKGSLAGNAMARAYKNLANESRQADLRRIGVEAVDASGNLRPLALILNELARATQGLGSAERLSIFESLFGRGQAAALKLASSSTAFDTLRDDIGRAGGIAIQTAEQMDAGIGGAFRRLLSAAEGVAIAVGEAIEQPVRRAADTLSKLAGWITKVVNRNRELIATIAKATAIVFGVGLALVVAGAAVVGLGAVFGGLASIVAGASAAIGVVVAVLGALLSPIGLVVAAIVGLGSAMAVSTGVVGDALAWLGDQFGRLRDRATSVVRGIADALATGDIGLAAEILWLSLKLIWQKGVAALNSVWLSARNFFITTAHKMWFGALAAAQLAWHGLEVAWIETTSFLSKTWTRFTTGFKKIWEAATSFVAKRLLEIQGLFDSSLDVEAAKRGVDEDLERRLSELETEQQQGLDERERRRQRQRDESAAQNDATLAEIGRQFEEAQDKLHAATDERVQRSQRELDAARAKLDEAIDRARRQREDESEDEFSAPRRSVDDIVGELQDRIAGVGQAIARGVTVRGTFSAAGVQGLLGAADAQERTADATEQTARNTKRLLDAARNGGLTFT